MKQSFQLNRTRATHASHGHLLLLVIAFILILVAIGGSGVWLRHLTNLSYARIVKLERDMEEQARAEDTLNNRIALLQSPERMSVELARIHSPLRLPVPSQVIQVNSTEFVASINRQPMGGAEESVLAYILSGRRENP